MKRYMAMIFAVVFGSLVIVGGVLLFVTGVSYLDSKLQTEAKRGRAEIESITAQIRNDSDIPEIDAEVISMIRYSLGRGSLRFGFIVKLPTNDIVYIYAMGTGLTPVLNDDREPMTIQEYEKLIAKDGA